MGSGTSFVALLGHPQGGVFVTERPERPGGFHGPPSGGLHPSHRIPTVLGRASDNSLPVMACDHFYAGYAVEDCRHIVAAGVLGDLEEDVAPPTADGLHDHDATKVGWHLTLSRPAPAEVRQNIKST